MTPIIVRHVRGLALAGSLVALAAFPTAVLAQMDHAGHGDDHGLAGARQMYEMVRGHLLATAEQVPEEMYAYRPTEEVRSMGQILGHVGNANFMFCSQAMGESSPATSDLEEAATKADLVAGLKASFEYCDRAYSGMSSDKLAEQVDLFGMQGSRLWVLIFNATHDWEHYGNLVTYMRMNDMVPPSSQGGM